MGVYEKSYTKNEYLFTRGFTLTNIKSKEYMFKVGDNDYEVYINTVGYLKTATQGAGNRIVKFEILEVLENDISITNPGTIVTPTILINKNRRKKDVLGDKLYENYVASYTNFKRLILSEGVASESNVETVTDLRYDLFLKTNCVYILKVSMVDNNVITGLDVALRGTIREL